MKKQLFLISIFCFFILTPTCFSAELLWDAGGGSPKGFRIYYGEDPSSLAVAAEVENSIYAYSIELLPLKSNTKYYFAVTAYDSSEETPISELISYITSDSEENTPPLPPTGVNVIMD